VASGVRPFRNLTAVQWQNLGIVALLAFYLIQIALDVAWGNIFGNLSIDFAAFWSAGYAADHYGFASVYDLGVMRQIEAALWPASAGVPADLRAIPVPFLPAFVLPFQLLSRLQPVAASAVWMLLNVLALGAYVVYFASKPSGNGPPPRLLIMLFVASPVFLNLFLGQANVWLTICVGEFMRAAMTGREFRAGIWLGGLLLKPQCLVLIVPALLLQRQLKTIIGALACSLAIVGASWLLAGSDALMALTRLWLGYAGGLPTNDPQLMMNWRMIGTYLARLTTPTVGLIAVIAGMADTSAVALAVWPRPDATDPMRLVIASVVLFAATGVVAWHSHVHMAMILLPPLLLLAHQNREALGNALEWWVFFPALLYILRILLAAILRAAGLGGGAYALVDFLAGTGLFATNLYLVGWGVLQLKPWRASPSVSGRASG